MSKKTKLKDEFKMGFGIRHARDELWYKKAIIESLQKAYEENYDFLFGLFLDGNQDGKKVENHRKV